MTLNLGALFQGIRTMSTDPNSFSNPIEDRYGFRSPNQNTLILINALKFASMNLNMGPLIHETRFGSTDPNSCLKLIMMLKGLGWSAPKCRADVVAFQWFGSLDPNPHRPFMFSWTTTCHPHLRLWV